MAIRVAGATFRPARWAMSATRVSVARVGKKKKRAGRAIANLFDSLRGGLAARRGAAISPSREMTRDDTANMKVK